MLVLLEQLHRWARPVLHSARMQDHEIWKLWVLEVEWAALSLSYISSLHFLQWSFTALSAWGDNKNGEGLTHVPQKCRFNVLPLFVSLSEYSLTRSWPFVMSSWDFVSR